MIVFMFKVLLIGIDVSVIVCVWKDTHVHKTLKADTDLPNTKIWQQINSEMSI